MATFLGYPFDPELFDYNWKAEIDPVLTAIVESGAMQQNQEIQALIANGSDTYTIPFYNVLGGTPENYDGNENITLTDVDGGSQTGIVYGRAHGWKEKEFVIDYNSGADPMKQITSQVGRYWLKQRQNKLITIADAVFGINGSGGFASWNDHKTDISSSDATVTADNKLGATSIGDAIQKAVGDHADQFRLAVMHSKVANDLAALDLLEYRKYTDAQGIQRPLRVADINGLTVIVDDGVPTTAGSSSKAATYTTYLFGVGAFQYAPANVHTPSEVIRDALTGGGYNALVTRVRETIHPNGFSFSKPSTGYTSSPTDAQLGASARWSVAVNPKAIAMARIISNG